MWVSSSFRLRLLLHWSGNIFWQRNWNANRKLYKLLAEYIFEKVRKVDYSPGHVAVSLRASSGHPCVCVRVCVLCLFVLFRLCVLACLQWARQTKSAFRTMMMMMREPSSAPVSCSWFSLNIQMSCWSHLHRLSLSRRLVLGPLADWVWDLCLKCCWGICYRVPFGQDPWPIRTPHSPQLSVGLLVPPWFLRWKWQKKGKHFIVDVSDDDGDYEDDALRLPSASNLHKQPASLILQMYVFLFLFLFVFLFVSWHSCNFISILNKFSLLQTFIIRPVCHHNSLMHSAPVSTPPCCSFPVFDSPPLSRK